MRLRSSTIVHILLLGGVVGACSLQVPSEKDVFSSATSGGQSGGGGKASAGKTNGGASNGGASSGGASNGGASNGGASSGGANAGAAATSPAGASAGRTGATGGVPSNGGSNLGGSNLGGASTGGSTNPASGAGGVVGIGGSSIGAGGAEASGGQGVGGNSNTGGNTSGGSGGNAGTFAGGAGGNGGNAGVAGSTSPGAGGAPSPLNVGLVAYFKFDDGAASVVTNSVDSTKNGTCYFCATASSQKFGRAIELRNDGATGITNYIELPPGILSGLSEMTISIWFYDRSSTRRGARLYDFATGTTTHFFFVPHDANTTLGLDGAQLAGEVESLPFVNLWYTTVMLVNSAWHNALVTWNAQKIDYYIDGQLAGTQATPVLLPSQLSTTAPNWIGRNFGDLKPKAYIWVDDLRIYDRVLSDTEIAMLYNML